MLSAKSAVKALETAQPEAIAATVLWRGLELKQETTEYPEYAEGKAHGEAVLQNEGERNTLAYARGSVRFSAVVIAAIQDFSSV